MLTEKSYFENEPAKASFQEQFKKRERIETEGGAVETVDINPDAERTPFLWSPAKKREKNSGQDIQQG